MKKLLRSHEPVIKSIYWTAANTETGKPVLTTDLPMLKTIPTTGCLVSRTMPVDFAAYLLSSSPPASSFELLNCAFSSRDTWAQIRNGYVRKDLSEDLNEEKDSFKTLKPIIIRCNSNNDDEDACSTCSSGSQSPQPPASPTRRKKKVSFADHNGLALATVKIMTEPSHVPPRLRPDILASITQGASAGVTEQPPLKLNFPQPASDYLTFRDRLEQNCVSLENVILRDYSVLGTVKVKNLSFDKQVFLRYTVDSWESHSDVVANYVKGQDELSSGVNDTFSFEFDVLPNFDMTKKIEFAVCYEANGCQYWDNNNGKNYEILPESFNRVEIPQSTPSVSTDFSSLKNVSDWTTFACWNNVDTNTPYW